MPPVKFFFRPCHGPHAVEPVNISVDKELMQKFKFALTELAAAFKKRSRKPWTLNRIL